MFQYGWMTDRILYHSFHVGRDIGEQLPPPMAVQRLVFFIWQTGLHAVLAWLEHACARRPQDSFHFLCCDGLLAKQLAARGISAHHISHNAFIDEELFTLAESLHEERRYDAVYVARMNPFKRHALARKIPRLLLVGNVVCHDDDTEYAKRLQEEMPHAEFTLDQKWLGTSDVVQRMHQSCVGLILSAEEGGSYVTGEYQLCGLPVVSTVAKGGRDSYLRGAHCRIVPADPQSIANAVAELKAANLSPSEIRAHALGIIIEQRRRLFLLGQTIYEAEGLGRDFARDFYGRFRHRMADWQAAEDLMKRWPGESVGG